MSRFLVDEDLPRSLASALRGAGLEATDVRDEGLRGQPDARIFTFAQSSGFVIVTADVEFANELVYPPATHHGVVLARAPSVLAAPTLVQMLVRALTTLAGEALVAAIVVVEPGRIRIRRTAPG
jgi:predicted nuclease of predicted toxin-antitoxin system